MMGSYKLLTAGVLVLALLVSYGCSTPRPAPVSERHPQTARPSPKPAPAAKAPAKEAEVRPEFYTVKKGDTLYSIALDHGLDYKELAGWNNVDNPNAIRVDQQLRLRAPTAGAVVTPLKAAPAVDGKPVTGASTSPAAVGETVKSQPKAVKLPYSDEAFARLSGPPKMTPAAPMVAKVEPRPEEKPAANGEDEEKVDWGWPATGKLVGGFSETASLKGIGIAGKLGQAVVASAPGKVVYSGAGLRGYGKLIIIKHNKAYLSVYAHNSEILVKEGQTVVRGQKIGEMGSTDADQVKLHFEIRRFGKPVDPLKLLPANPPA